MNAEYQGGNIVRLTATAHHDGNTLEQANMYVTMTELRAMMDELERSYRSQSCCPSCGTLTLDGSVCADCLRYEESAQDINVIRCYHGVPLDEFCYECHDDTHRS